MSSGNRINIPWYRRNVRYGANGGFADSNNPTLDFNLPRIPKPRTRPRTRGRQKPQRERVRERVRENVREREPSRVPNRYPILDPRQQPNPQDDQGKNPYREPSANPIPVPIPKPNPAPDTRRDPGATPGVNQKQPTPQSPLAPVPGGGFAFRYEIPSIIPPIDYKYQPKHYTPEQKQWADDFIANLELVARLTAIEAKNLYVFTRDYNYETNNLSQFTTDAQAEFGVAAGSILAIMVGAKSLAQLWGKRITAGFAPVIKLDDEYMEDHFGTKIY